MYLPTAVTFNESPLCAIRDVTEDLEQHAASAPAETNVWRVRTHVYAPTHTAWSTSRSLYCIQTQTVVTADR